MTDSPIMQPFWSSLYHSQRIIVLYLTFSIYVNINLRQKDKAVNWQQVLTLTAFCLFFYLSVCYRGIMDYIKYLQCLLLYRVYI